MHAGVAPGQFEAGKSSAGQTSKARRTRRNSLAIRLLPRCILGLITSQTAKMEIPGQKWFVSVVGVHSSTSTFVTSRVLPLIVDTHSTVWTTPAAAATTIWPLYGMVVTK